MFVLAAIAECASPRLTLRGGVTARWAGNLGLFLVNRILPIPLAAVLVAGVTATTGAPHPEPGTGWGWTVAGLLAIDLLLYALHRLHHAVPLLWRFHAVHHSDLDVDVTTAVRHHPGEVFANSVAIGLVAVLVGIATDTILLYGGIVLTAQLMQHANLRLPQRLERVLGIALVTPRAHRIHHSAAPADADRNYGAVLSLWDRVFGSYAVESATGDDVGDFGVAGLDGRRWQAFHRLLLLPLGRLPGDRRSGEPRLAQPVDDPAQR